MKAFGITASGGIGLLLLSFLAAPRVAAQDPVVVPVIAEAAAPIVAKVIKPKPKPAGIVKYEGYFMHGNVAQITVRAKGNDLGIQTFPLAEATAAKMQRIIDSGGYQYGDQVTVYYDVQTGKAVEIKGKPSRPL